MPEYPRPKWLDFYKAFAKRWKQGEHIFINGKTGSGKTELALRLLNLTPHSAFFVTKPRDPIFKSQYAEGYERMSEWKPTARHHRIMLAAKRGDSTRQDVGNQQEIFSQAFDDIYKSGGWAVGVDESLWISNRLKLANAVGDAAYMGRALGLTYVFATQRPAHIPPIVPQSATHAFLGLNGRASDLKTLGELGHSPRELMEAIKSLDNKHDFVYYDADGDMPVQIINTHA